MSSCPGLIKERSYLVMFQTIRGSPNCKGATLFFVSGVFTWIQPWLLCHQGLLGVWWEPIDLQFSLPCATNGRARVEGGWSGWSGWSWVPLALNWVRLFLISFLFWINYCFLNLWYFYFVPTVLSSLLPTPCVPYLLLNCDHTEVIEGPVKVAWFRANLGGQGVNKSDEKEVKNQPKSL